MSLADDIAEGQPTPEDRLLADIGRIRERAERKAEKAAYEAALRRIEFLEAQNALLVSLNDRKAKEPAEPKTAKRGTATAILVLSDWHVEEPVRLETVNGINEYNLTVAERRINAVFERALMLLDDSRHLAKIDELVVAVLGDLISGWIHEELREINLLAPLPATMFAADLLERGLLTLQKHAKVSRIIVPTCHGNHGRTTDKMRSDMAAETSYEYNLYLHLRKRLEKHRKIHWQIGQGYHNYLDVQGYPIRFHHGDALQFNGGVGGVTISANKAVAQWDKGTKAYLDVWGHFHHFIPYGKWIQNSSVIGYGARGVRIKVDPNEPPRQTFIVIDKKRGLTRALPVFCD